MDLNTVASRASPSPGDEVTRLLVAAEVLGSLSISQGGNPATSDEGIASSDLTQAKESIEDMFTRTNRT